MNRDIWHELLSLESNDITRKRFYEIHSKKLDERRSREINSAAKQAREYFRNASTSDHTVRPLLTFYGVVSLSRSLMLLLKANGGEEGLSSGHGIETVGWRNAMSGRETMDGLRSLESLAIRTRRGRFWDFLEYTSNRVSVHIGSGGIDWSCSYPLPMVGETISLADLFSRIPDLQKDYSEISDNLRYSNVQEFHRHKETGEWHMRVSREPLCRFRDSYEEQGYEITDSGNTSIIVVKPVVFDHCLPLFVHSYIEADFGIIPRLHLVEPFPGGTRYSQLCITYMVSFILGTIVRYYPTHWIALIQGAGGDAMWPTVNRAQQIVEQSYPKLVALMIRDAATHGHPIARRSGRR